jgi:SSS family solute:Na+ symporter
VKQGTLRLLAGCSATWRADFVVFFFGVFMKRLNGMSGCSTTGFLLGAFRLAVDTPVSLRMAGFERGYAEGSFLWIVNNIYFQYYSLLISRFGCSDD